MSYPLIKFFEKIANSVELLAIVFIIFMASFLQFTLYELPCPLCLLQRIGFLMMALGFLMNSRFGFRSSHYAMVILSGLFTSFVALRQISLHVIPGTGAYGSAIFGLHLYTWSYLASMAIIILTVLLSAFDRQYLGEPGRQRKHPKGLTNLLFAFVALLIIINFVSVSFECGLIHECPDNPVAYRWSL